MAGYGNDEGFTTWLTENGYSLPANAPSKEVLRNRGASYVDATYGAKLNCSHPTGGVNQERAWPRSCAVVHGQVVPDDQIPQAWVNASYRAAYLIASNANVFSSTINPAERVKRQKADVLEREFFDAGQVGAGNGALSVIDAEIDAMVSPYLCKPMEGNGIGIWSIGR